MEVRVSRFISIYMTSSIGIYSVVRVVWARVFTSNRVENSKTRFS